jgi:SAM-dependent methyltransferase
MRRSLATVAPGAVQGHLARQEGEIQKLETRLRERRRGPTLDRRAGAGSEGITVSASRGAVTLFTDYDTIAEDYRRAKQQPWRSLVESYTLMGLVGDLAGKAVVDLACGEGHYTRRLRRHGASRVVGVDLSEGMIALARTDEAAHPLGIEYLVDDAKGLHLPEGFDVAVAAYLLNYARDRGELGAMCRSVARCLRPGGRFVTVNTNPGLDFDRLPPFRKYGFDVELEGDLAEGTPITWTFDLAGGLLRVENYHLGMAAHEEALLAAGFREVQWHLPRLSPAGEAADGRAYWEPLLSSAPVIFLECRLCP